MEAPSVAACQPSTEAEISVASRRQRPDLPPLPLRFGPRRCDCQELPPASPCEYIAQRQTTAGERKDSSLRTYAMNLSESAAIALQGIDHVPALANGLSYTAVQEGQLVLKTTLPLLWRDRHQVFKRRT